MDNSNLLDGFVVCNSCKQEVSLEGVVCPDCKLPLINDFKKLDRFSREDRLVSHQLKDSADRIKKSRTFLFFISGLVLIQYFFALTIRPDTDTALLLIEGVFISLIYFGCAFFIPKLPGVCLSIAFATFLVLMFLQYIENPSTLTSGIIFKLVMFFGIGTGLYHVFRYNRIIGKLRQRF